MFVRNSDYSVPKLNIALSVVVILGTQDQFLSNGKLEVYIFAAPRVLSALCACILSIRGARLYAYTRSPSNTRMAITIILWYFATPNHVQCCTIVRF